MLAVWIAETRTQSHEFLRSTVLDESERARCSAMMRRELSEQYTVAHALKRLCLAEWLNEADPRSLSFTRLAFGKPALLGAGVEFNLSHCANACSVVVSAGAPCGVDVEPRRTIRSLPSLIERSMSPAERRAIARCPDVNQDFIDRWVVKEAYTKMTGRGLGEDFKDICTERELRWLGPEFGRLRDAFIWRRDLGSHVVAVSSGRLVTGGAGDVEARSSDTQFRGLTARRYGFSRLPYRTGTRSLEQIT